MSKSRNCTLLQAVLLSDSTDAILMGLLQCPSLATVRCYKPYYCLILMGLLQCPSLATVRCYKPYYCLIFVSVFML